MGAGGEVDPAGIMGTEPSTDGSDRARTRARVVAGLFGEDSSEDSAEDGRVAGRFEIVRHLGAGAMGEVVLARDVELGREVALKRLTTSSRANPQRRERILREARALAKVHHPHVVTLFEVLTEDSDVMLVMEYVPGTSLAQWLAGGPSRPQILDHLAQAARGLAAIHAAGLVHRDFKPDNVLVGEDGRVRVADLGLARRDTVESTVVEPDAAVSTADESDADAVLRTQPEAALTRTGALVGTPAYMAPEQLAGAPADALSDQFAWGVTLHEALLGVRPFAGDTAESLATAVRAGERVPVPTRELPRWLVRVMDRTLEVDPGRRYRSMDEVVLALERGARPPSRFAIAAGLTVVLATAGIAVMADATPAAAPDPCPRRTDPIDEVWSPAVQQSLRERIAAEIDPADADALSAAIEHRMSAYGTAWIDEQQHACQQTRVEGMQTTDDLQRRTQCLGRRRATLQGLVNRIPAMDTGSLKRLPRALAGLQPPSDCATPQATTTHAQPVVAALDRARVEILLADFDDATTTLDQAESALDEQGPDVEAGLRAELTFDRAEISRGRAEIGQAKTLYLKAAELAEASRRDRLAAETWLRLVGAEATEDRDPERAAFYLSRARAAVSRLGHPPRLEAQLAHKAGQQALTDGRYDEAVALLDQAQRLFKTAQADALTTAPVQMDLARANYQRGAYTEAAEAFEAVVAIYEAEYGRRHPRVASALNNLGASLVMADRLDEALPVLERALEIRRARLGEHNGKVGQTLNALASVHLQRGELEAALTSYREAVQVQTAAYGPDHPVLGASLANVGRALSRLGRHEEAIAELTRAVDIVSAALGDAHPDVADALQGLATAQLAAGRADEAVQTYQRALRIRQTAFGDDAAKTAETGVSLAEALGQAGHPRQARETIERWIGVLRKTLGKGHASVRQAEATLQRWKEGP